jgi:integrase
MSPLHPRTAELVADYLEIAGHAGETAGALFRPVKNNVGGTVERAVTADGIYKMVKHYAKYVGVNIEGFGAHSLRATPRPMRLTMKPTSPRCRSGSGMPISPLRGSMIGGRPGRRTARRLR